METPVPRTTRVLALVLVALLTTAVVGLATPAADAASTSTSSSAPAATTSTTAPANGPQPIHRTIWGQDDPSNAPGQTLYLQQVVIDPGAKLPEHYHQGTQVATVRAGVLTYHVVDGTATVTRANGHTEQVTGPATVRLRRGDGLVEPQSMAHYGANKGRVPVVLELTALLTAGAPLSTAVGASTETTPMHLAATLVSESRTLQQVGADGAKTYGWNRLIGSAVLDGQPVTVDMLASVQYTAGSGPFSGFVTFTFADGSTLAVSMQGATTAQPDSTDASFAATLGVFGGTGSYLHVTGSGMFHGTRRAALGGQVDSTFDLDLGGVQ